MQRKKLKGDSAHDNNPCVTPSVIAPRVQQVDGLGGSWSEPPIGLPPQPPPVQPHPPAQPGGQSESGQGYHNL
jgi:hypothetical protein